MTADVELLPLPESDCQPNALRWLFPAGQRERVQDYARACVAHATAAKDAEIEALRARTAVTLGVGTGDGRLFIHGDYESVKAAQAIVLQRDALRAEVERSQEIVRPKREEECMTLDHWLIGDLMEAEEGGHTEHTPAELCGLAAKALKSLIAQQPAVCPKCDGTGEADSGGIYPWGAPATIPCGCQHPAAVDGEEGK